MVQASLHKVNNYRALLINPTTLNAMGTLLSNPRYMLASKPSDVNWYFLWWKLMASSALCCPLAMSGHAVELGQFSVHLDSPLTLKGSKM